MTDCHRPLSLAIPPPVTGAGVPVTPVSYHEPPMEPYRNHNHHRERRPAQPMPKRGMVVVENIQRDDSVRTDYAPIVVDPDNPLVRKLHDIQNRYREKQGQTD